MRARCGGFTLIELLVVIAIIGLVMTIGTSTFVAVSAAWNERRAITELDHQAEAALDSIRTDLASALSSDLAGATVTGNSREVKDSRTYPAATYADDDLSMVTNVDTNHGGAIAKVGYRVDRNGATGVLVRTTGPAGGEFPAGGRMEMVSGRVQGFSVEYLGRGPGAVWNEKWAGPGQPAAVRVSIALESAARPEFQTCRKAVIAIHVQ